MEHVVRKAKLVDKLLELKEIHGCLKSDYHGKLCDEFGLSSHELKVFYEKIVDLDYQAEQNGLLPQFSFSDENELIASIRYFSFNYAGHGTSSLKGVDGTYSSLLMQFNLKVLERLKKVLPRSRWPKEFKVLGVLLKQRSKEKQVGEIFHLDLGIQSLLWVSILGILEDKYNSPTGVSHLSQIQEEVSRLLKVIHTNLGVVKKFDLFKVFFSAYLKSKDFHKSKKKVGGAYACDLFWIRKKEPGTINLRPSKCSSLFNQFLRDNDLGPLNQEALGKSLRNEDCIIRHQKGSTMLQKTFFGKREYFWEVRLNAISFENEIFEYW